MLSCSFTGHRPDKLPCGNNEQHPACIRIKAALLQQITRLYEQRGVNRFIAGGAIGVDQWAAEAVLAFRADHPDVVLLIAVPFRGQPEKFLPEQQARYQEVLEEADDVVVLQEQYTKDCFFKRNDYMIAHSEVVVAVYDINTRVRSGTGYTVNQAIKLERNIIFIDPVTQSISYHVGKRL